MIMCQMVHVMGAHYCQLLKKLKEGVERFYDKVVVLVASGMACPGCQCNLGSASENFIPVPPVDQMIYDGNNKGTGRLYSTMQGTLTSQIEPQCQR